MACLSTFRTLAKFKTVLRGSFLGYYGIYFLKKYDIIKLIYYFGGHYGFSKNRLCQYDR
ncbi:protein of unknown function [Streptococcus thermophilus]|nr:protein of unknown function [Streptococcus thermophilus]CAD0150219.1 protein of unknown function [Streptococcus thermophilus]